MTHSKKIGRGLAGSKVLLALGPSLRADAKAILVPVTAIGRRGAEAPLDVEYKREQAKSAELLQRNANRLPKDGQSFRWVRPFWHNEKAINRQP
jgi:hypothetical protein